MPVPDFRFDATPGSLDPRFTPYMPSVVAPIVVPSWVFAKNIVYRQSYATSLSFTSQGAN